MMNKPKKIIATGDIHIFPHKRFLEHEHVFDKFYIQLDLEKPDLIILTGDIVDSKNKLSPEQINICRNFFVEISNRAEVIIINGNHDQIANNKERLDALTPIIDSIKNITINKIHHFKESKLYQIPNYDVKFAVWSWFENNSNPIINKEKNDYIIGLFHGVIEGAVNEDGYKLSGGIAVKEFDKCDFVIASDIHHQMSFRNDEINYTGSLLQVSVNENPEGSFLIYTLDNDKYKKEVRRIVNDYSTINIIVGDTLKINPLPTQKIRLKFNPDITSRSQAQELLKEIKEKYNVRVDIVPNIKKKDKSVILIDKKEEITYNNILDFFNDFVKNNQEKLDIKDYNNDLKKLLEYDINFSQGDVKEFEQGDYFIYKMIVNNVLSYKPEETIIDLDKEGLFGILGKNRCGKSSIIKIIQFVLFNEIPNNSSSIKMINKYNRKKSAFAEVYFTKAGKNYKVRRSLNPDKKGLKISVDLSFHEIDIDGKEIFNLTKESRPYTDTELKKYLGINDFFEMLSLFSAQKRQVEFIDCKNAERLKHVNKYLGVQEFELKEKNVLEVLKEKNAVYNNILKQFDKEINLKSLQNDLLKNETLIKILDTESKELSNELFELETDYVDILSLYNSNLKNSLKVVKTPTEILKNIDSLNLDKINLENKILENNKLIEIHILESEKLIKRFKILYFDDYFDFEGFQNERLIKFKEKLTVTNYEINQIKKQSDIDVCGNCGKEMTQLEKNKLIEKLDLLEKEKENAIEIIDEINSANKEAKDLIWQIENILNTIDNIKEKDNPKIEIKVKDILISQNNLKSLVLEFDKVEESKTIVSMLQNKIATYNNEKININTNLNKNNSQTSVYKSQIKEMNFKIYSYKTKIKELEELEEEIRLLKAYRKVVNKDGLPLYILNNKIDEINDKVNMIINQVFEFNLNFSIDDEKGELKIQFNYDDEEEKNDVGLASGSEMFIINLCIKVALAQISNLPKIDTIFIDEGYDSLDYETIDKLPALFNVLTNYYKNIITISHLDTIKDMCTSQLFLKKVGKYTEIL